MKRHYSLGILATALLCLANASPAQAEQTTTVVVTSVVVTQEKSHPLEAQFRSRTYKAVEPVKQLMDRMMLVGYNTFENPTGIYFTDDEDVIITVNGTSKALPKLYVKNFLSENKNKFETYDLKEGENKITIKSAGLGYISYETEDYANAPEIRVSIQGGKVNGIFTSQDSNDTWNALLKNAVSPVMDLYGEHIHLAFPVKELIKNCPDNGKELLAFYDQIVSIEQKVIGFAHKQERPRNHMFGRVVSSGYMFADGFGAGFNKAPRVQQSVLNLNSLKDPKNITHGYWGIAHELGHCNQTRPGFRWLGLVEVTNNLLAMACCYEMNKPVLRLEREPQDDGVSRKLPGAYYNLFTKSALIDKELWQLQVQGRTGHSNVGGGNVFVKLIPLWQLYLYTTIAEQGNKDFYPEFNYRLRQMSPEGVSHGQHQLNFMKLACEINELDLTGFFETVGMLKPIDVDFRDYGKGKLTITQEQCDELKKFASQYKKPDSPVIYYMNANNVDAFKDKKALNGPDAPGEGIKQYCHISHNVWKNAVAFECYAGEELISITLAGVGAANFGDPETKVYMPNNLTEIKAVGWDGARKTVYKK